MRNRPFLSLLLALFAGLLSADSLTQAADPIKLPEASTEMLKSVLEDLKTLRAAGDVSAQEIQLPSGRYPLTEPIVLTPEYIGEGLTLRAVEAGKVIFDGAVELEERGQDKARRWHFGLPEGWKKYGIPRVLLIDNKLQTAARHPNKGYLRIEKALEDRRSGFVYSAEGFPIKLDFEGTICDLVLLHDWSSSRLPVASIEESTRTLKTLGPIGCRAKHYRIDHFEKQPRYWLEGHPRFADQQGEWFVLPKSNSVGLISETELAPQVRMPIAQQLFVIQGNETQKAKSVKLNGLVFTGTRFPMPEGGLAGAQASMHEPRNANGELTDGSRPMLSAAVEVVNAQGVQFNNCVFRDLGNTGLWIGRQTTGCRVFRSQVLRTGGNGINLGEGRSRRVDGKTWCDTAPEQVATKNLLKDSQIRHVGKVLPGAVGVWAGITAELEISGNRISDTPYTGISMGWMWNPKPTPARNNRILNNTIQYPMQMLSDGGGIYTLGLQPDSRIEGNIITDVPLNAGRAESNGMFLDEGTSGFTIRNNIIRRVDRSPIRFHKAGNNLVTENQWELATPQTPEVRFNNTPEANITRTKNTILNPQKSYYLIGNSLTWDTLPPRLEGNVHWHVDCGKPLPYILANPDRPCVGTSRLWPDALTTAQFDYLSMQTHYGSTLESDFASMSHWIDMQPEAILILHTGWARSADFAQEYQSDVLPEKMIHHTAYWNKLLQMLKQKYPTREFRMTSCTEILESIRKDIKAGKAPQALTSLTDLYRDAIHLKQETGRYLMHNAMRAAMDQPPTEEGFPAIEPTLKAYLDQKLSELAFGKWGN